MPLPIFQILCLFFFGVIALYIWAVRRNGYWRRRGIPGPVPVPFKGNLDAMFGNRLNQLQLWRWSREFGRVYGIQYGWHQVLVISDPKMVHELLVDKFDLFYGRLLLPEMEDPEIDQGASVFMAKGNRWKRLRTILNPTFSVANLKKYQTIMADSIHHAMDFLAKASAESMDGAVNLKPYFVEMTNDVLQRVAFGQPDSQQWRNDHAQMTRRVMEHTNTNVTDYYGWQFPWLGRHVFRPYHRLLAPDPTIKLRNKLMRLMEQCKQEKKNQTAELAFEEEHKTTTTFIDTLLEAEADSNSISNGNNNNKSIGNGNSFNYKRTATYEKKMSSEEILLTCQLLSLAGFDTTYNTLSLLCHFLALHPEVQEKVRAEIDLNCDEEPTYEQLGQLKYTEAALKETLRLYPIATFVLTRICEQTTQLGAYTVEKGTVVWIDSFTLGRDTELFGEDAEEFRPERWLERPIAPTAFVAFGGGPRICIGMRFALLQLKIALCHLLRRFTLRKCARTENLNELQLTGHIVFSPTSVTVQLESR